MKDRTSKAERKPVPTPNARQRTQKLWRVEQAAREHERSNPAESRRIIDVCTAHVNTYDASPNTWHTLAMIAGRVNHYEARLVIVQAGLRQWPEDVDLLCEEMQMLTTPTEGYDPSLGEGKWRALEKTDRGKTGPYWRFWVYGAIYLARFCRDPKKALEFLDEGLTRVNRDGLMDIFRSYRRVLVDSAPLRALVSTSAVRQYQAWATKTLEERLTLGLQLGLENGYVLAAELAQLYQERAAVEGGEDNLNEALVHLETAEKLYTGSPNHPIWDIYVSRARLLVALRRYGDALKLLRSLPSQERADPSIQTMLQLASLVTGEPLDAGPAKDNVGTGDAMSALPLLMSNNGELLLRVARQHEEVGAIVASVAQRLRQPETGETQ